MALEHHAAPASVSAPSLGAGSVGNGELARGRAGSLREADQSIWSRRAPSAFPAIAREHCARRAGMAALVDVACVDGACEARRPRGNAPPGRRRRASFLSSASPTTSGGTTRTRFLPCSFAQVEARRLRDGSASSRRPPRPAPGTVATPALTVICSGEVDRPSRRSADDRPRRSQSGYLLVNVRAAALRTRRRRAGKPRRPWRSAAGDPRERRGRHRAAVAVVDPPKSSTSTKSRG